VSNDYNDFNRALIADLRANRGKASGGPFKGGQILILTTKGAKTGEPREHPLAYSEDDGLHVIVASKGGAPTNPHWFHNLQTHPIVTVEVEGETYTAKAKVVEDDEEYERLYTQHAALMPGFNDYRKKTNRRIPVIVLEPVDEAVA
jgi:deazaflavin-dependent oxidoreductase (nitroreductase family)